jgi:hypothetical protein
MVHREAAELIVGLAVCKETHIELELGEPCACGLVVVRIKSGGKCPVFVGHLIGQIIKAGIVELVEFCVEATVGD